MIVLANVLALTIPALAAAATTRTCEPGVFDRGQRPSR